MFNESLPNPSNRNKTEFPPNYLLTSGFQDAEESKFTDNSTIPKGFISYGYHMLPTQLGTQWETLFLAQRLLPYQKKRKSTGVIGKVTEHKWATEVILFKVRECLNLLIGAAQSFIEDGHEALPHAIGRTKYVQHI
jgi:hypothetical protein